MSVVLDFEPVLPPEDASEAEQVALLRERLPAAFPEVPLEQLQFCHPQLRPDWRSNGLALPGQIAPDGRAFARSGRPTTLWAQLARDRPTVLYFGSYSCPSCRLNVPRWNQLAARHGTRAKFVFVCILEAHARHQWELPGNLSVPQPQNLVERLLAANLLHTGIGIRTAVVADDIGNALERQYEARPSRLYILEGGRVAYRGGIAPYWVKLDAVDDWLRRHG